MSIGAMKQAIDALQCARHGHCDHLMADQAIEALRTAIQQAEAQQPATPEPVGEPIAWEAASICYAKYITDSRYQKLNPEFQRWYKPYRCSACDTRPAHAAQAVPMTEDAARLDWMASRSAHIGWDRDGDYCRVWAVEDEEIGQAPITGWHDSARAAIDAARGITAQAKEVQS